MENLTNEKQYYNIVAQPLWVLSRYNDVAIEFHHGQFFSSARKVGNIQCQLRAEGVKSSGREILNFIPTRVYSMMRHNCVQLRRWYPTSG